MDDVKVLLVLIGALGDLAKRKFLDPARELEMMNAGLNTLLVDVPWDRGSLPVETELRLRIGRRMIELRGEKIAKADSESLEDIHSRFLISDLGATPLPWEIEKFVSDCLDPDMGDVKEVAKQLQAELDRDLDWFTGSSRVGLQRYTSNPKEVMNQIIELKNQGTKVAVFLATPPVAYPGIIDQWNGIADRIVFEKPAAGLDPRTLEYPSAVKLREAVSRIKAPAQCVSCDHYNAKLITRAMDRIRDYHLFDYLLDLSRVSRIVVELLEEAPLPLGRCSFYNGAGGAFGDMVPHLLQAVRAILGVTTGMIEIRFGNELYRAQYHNAPLEHRLLDLTGEPYCFEPGFYRPLSPETETFVAFEAEVFVKGLKIPLYCRTGKGFRPERKSLRVDCRYNDRGEEVGLVFDFKNQCIAVRDGYKGFGLETGRLILDEPFKSGVPGLEPEYQGIFESMIKSDWGSAALDTRYFPSATDAVDMADKIFRHLIAKRREGRPMYRYTAGDATTTQEVMNLLSHKARW